MNGLAALADAAFRYMVELDQVSDTCDLPAAFRPALALAGMAHAASGVLALGGPQLAHFHFVDWPSGWMALNEREQFLFLDPLARWAFKSGLSLSWQDLRRALPARDPGHRVLDAGFSYGFTDGFVVPVRGVNGAAGLIATAGFGPLLRPEDKLFLQMVCTATWRCAERLDPRAGHPPAFLPTRRELDCLACLVRGLSDKEIARALALSEVTVRFHVGNLRRKTGARSRAHLAALAVSLHIVSL